jgi:2-polyprenyl-6-methoxyphenol hydroxylase-like FAD-dependent oxidoreductase
VLKRAENDDITPSLKFKDVLDNKISSVLVPLQEYVFRQWHFKRIITIGDAAHKVRHTALRQATCADSS